MLLKISSGLPKVFRCVTSECSDIKEMAAAIVKDYLSGQWRMANPDNVIVQKLKGGLSNWLYSITLSSLQHTSNEAYPNTVLLRIHGHNYGKFASEQIVKDSLVFMLMSERRLGPKLHGVFPGGRIEEYIPARSLKTAELGNQKLSLAIASKIARIHSLNVPISKNPEYLLDLMSDWLAELLGNWEEYKAKNDQIQELMNKFKAYDLVNEIKWLRKHLRKFDSKIVFSHNDLQEGNILLRHDSVSRDEPTLVVIDYEYCSYNSRAFDLANHFLEYAISNEAPEYPHFTVNFSCYPSLDHQVKFVQKYLDVYNNISKVKNSNFGENKIRSTESNSTSEVSDLLIEISNYRLLSHLLWGIWGAAQSKTGIDFGFWEYCIMRLEAYFKTKSEIAPDEFPKVRKKI